MIEPGITGERVWTVNGDHLASQFGSGLVDALATPVLVGFCEECARTLVEGQLAEGERTVGTSVTLDHLAATPPGMNVTVCATLVAVDGRRLSFEVTARDEIEDIGRGTHERFIIDAARFDRGLADKAARMTADA